MMGLNLRTALLAGVLALGATTGANAVVTTFSGQDDGAPLGGPYTNSAAAEAAFLAAAAANGAVVTETFESQAVGFYSPVAIINGTVSYATDDYGPGLSGINNTTFGNVFGFNVTPGGEQWLGFPDFFNSSATFVFDTPTNAFGFWTTGVQTLFTASIEVIQLDGTLAVYSIPVNVDGGTSYFGFIDSTLFTAVRIVNTGNNGLADAWGIDDVSYNVVPEPAAWALMIVGFGLVGAAARRRRGIVSITA